MIGRRAFVAGFLVAIASSAHGKKAPPPPKVGAIRWPGPGYELHGFMAVPSRAHGPQPAVLIIPDTTGADIFALGVVDALAAAGFVTCIPSALASAEEGVATVRWLAGNRYATGKVGVIGIGWGSGLVRQIMSVPDVGLACAIRVGGDEAPTKDIVPSLDLPALTTAMNAAAWQQAVEFLEAYLEPTGKR